MKRVAMITLGNALCAMLAAIPRTAADKPAEKAPKTAATKASAVRSVWAPETLSGKIAMVDAAQDLVVVDDSSGVPFDMVITSRTHIKSAVKHFLCKTYRSTRTSPSPSGSCRSAGVTWRSRSKSGAEATVAPVWGVLNAK